MSRDADEHDQIYAEYSISDNDSDRESYRSYNSSEEEEEDECDALYDSEEASKTRFTLTICAKFDARIHGPPPGKMECYFIVCRRFKYWDNQCIDDETEHILRHVSPIQGAIRNVKMLVEIAECYRHPVTDHSMAILKTFWFKIVQRAWKRVFAERKDVLRKRCLPASLKHQELRGTWPHDCARMPTLRGMMSST